MNITFEEAEFLVMVIKPQLQMIKRIKSGALPVNDLLAIAAFAGIGKSDVPFVEKEHEQEVKEGILMKLQPFTDLRNKIKNFYGI